jgi:hypothetical protein
MIENGKFIPNTWIEHFASVVSFLVQINARVHWGMRGIQIGSMSMRG